MNRQPPTLPIPTAYAHAIAVGLDAHMVQHQDEMVQLLSWIGSLDVQLNIILEIGMHMGATTRVWASLAREMVIAVDLPDGPHGGISLENAQIRNTSLEADYPHVKTILGDSHDWRTRADVSKALAWKQVDLLFIDGDHSLQGVRQDFLLYRPFVRPGGVIAFHDIVESAFHHSVGAEVSQFWQQIEGPKVEFVCGSDWGGIGAMQC